MMNQEGWKGEGKHYNNDDIAVTIVLDLKGE